jgi:hypothetical protein
MIGDQRYPNTKRRSGLNGERRRVKDKKKMDGLLFFV